MKMVNRRTVLKGLTLAGLGAVSVYGYMPLIEKFALRELQEGEQKSLMARPAKEEFQVKYTADVMCPSECGLEVWVKDGVAHRIYGNYACPYNDGAICGKGAAGLGLVYSPYRIRKPMIRVGERGEGRFKEVSWEEAIDYIARKMIEIKKKYGPESVIVDTGDVTDRDQYWRLGFAFGTPNCVEHGAICDTPRRHGPKLMFNGKRIEPDIMTPRLVRQPDGSLAWDRTHRAKLIIYAGWNPFLATRINWESRGTVAAKVENGCRVIVIDPVFSNTATQADMWVPIRPGTLADLFAAMLRYILENDDPKDPTRRYIDWDFKKYSIGWEDFEKAFREWWDKTDPINGLKYFTLEWAENRTDIPKEKIKELAHLFGITKPAALVWGMQAPGHHYNGYCASILGTVLNVITGNFDAPGGAIDTEIVKSSKGGTATGKWMLSKKVKRVVNGQEVEGTVAELHMDHYSDWPSAWDDVVGDYPRRFREGVTIRYGSFRGHKYPIKAYILRTGNSVITAGATWDWIDALTAKEGGEYKVELVVVIDTIFLETALYADVLLPEASYLERMSLSDIYPTYPVIFLRDAVIEPLHESKKPTDIMNMLAKRLYELGDRDIRPEDFWEKYKSEEDFVNEMLEVAPGRPNVGQPLPYPQYPEGYTIIGDPESLEKGEVTIDHEKKVIRGRPLTVKWLREHKGVAVWPMSWYRYRKWDEEKKEWVPNKAWPPTASKMIEFVWDYTTTDGKRQGMYSSANARIEKTGEIPRGLREIGFEKFPRTFYWFEAKYNPYTNPKVAYLKNEYPFMLISGRVHHAMSGTQMVAALGQSPAEGTWTPLNKEVEVEVEDFTPTGVITRKKKFLEGEWAVGTVWINSADAAKLGIKMGDLVKVENHLKRSVVGRAYVSEAIKPGVVKIAFAAGGRFSPGIGPTYVHKDYTPDYNMLVIPDNLTPIMGQPAFTAIPVKVEKL